MNREEIKSMFRQRGEERYEEVKRSFDGLSLEEKVDKLIETFAITEKFKAQGWRNYD